jgi:acyl-CoA synthetase (NDP forming)
MTSVSQLKPFLEPRSIAVVGANPNTGEQAFNVVENLANCGYQGKVYPVNPNYKKILGKTCYASVKNIPSNVDLAIIVTPLQTVSQIVKQCGDKDIKAAIVVGQGFADADDEGKRLQLELVEVARKSRVRILGPNTVSSANAFIDFSAAFLKQADAFPDKPITWCPYDGWLFNIRSRDLQDTLEETGRAAVFSIPDDAVSALSRLADYSEFRNRSQ